MTKCNCINRIMTCINEMSDGVNALLAMAPRHST